MHVVIQSQRLNYPLSQRPRETYDVHGCCPYTGYKMYVCNLIVNQAITEIRVDDHVTIETLEYTRRFHDLASEDLWAVVETLAYIALVWFA